MSREDGYKIRKLYPEEPAEVHISGGINCPPYETADGFLQTTEGFIPQVDMILNLVIIIVILGGYSPYLVKTFPLKQEHSNG